MSEVRYTPPNALTPVESFMGETTVPPSASILMTTGVGVGVGVGVPGCGVAVRVRVAVRVAVCVGGGGDCV
jgi:hypothetical protein